MTACSPYCASLIGAPVRRNTRDGLRLWFILVLKGKNSMQQMTNGFGYLFKGFSMLTKPGIKRYVFIPLFINIILFLGFFFLALHYFSDFVTWFDHKIPHFLQWLNWILWPMFALACLFIIAYSFIIIANLIAAPFNSFLAEKVELVATGKKPNPDESTWDAIKDLPRVMKREVDKLVYYLPRAVILLVLFLIPGINIIATVLWFLFGCWVMSMQYVDYPMDLHKVSFEEMRKKMRKKPFMHLTFGCAVVIILLIPVVNFLLIPASVIGATLMYLDHERVGGTDQKD